MLQKVVRILPLLITFLYNSDCISQKTKPSIEMKDFGKWSSIANPSISNDGRFVLHSITNVHNGVDTLYLQSTSNEWRLKMPDYAGIFSQNNRLAMCFSYSQKKLALIHLGTSKIDYIENVKSYKFPNSGSGEWLATEKEDTSRGLCLTNLSKGFTTTFYGVKEYVFGNTGKVLLLHYENLTDGDKRESVVWVDLEKMSNDTIWTNSNKDIQLSLLESLLSKNESQLAFVVVGKHGGMASKSILHYNNQDKKTSPLVDSMPIDSALQVSHIHQFGFSTDGKWLYIFLENVKKINPPLFKKGVDVWSYADGKLQSQQLADMKQENKFLSVVNVQTRRLTRLEGEGDKAVGFFNSNNKYIMVVNRQGSPDTEWHWNKGADASIYLISIHDGSRKIISSKIQAYRFGGDLIDSYRLSPTEEYIVYYSPDKRGYLSYDIKANVNHFITQGIIANWTSYKTKDIPIAEYLPIGVAGWIDSRSVLIYDRNDIFRADVTGRRSSQCITKSLGKKTGMVFRFSADNGNRHFKEDDTPILNVYERATKNNGFYRINFKVNSIPQKLSMQPYFFEGPSDSYDYTYEPIKKAKDTNLYVVRRMTASESPNYYITSDFSSFKSFTACYPEKHYNWLTTELITLKDVDGNEFQGVLYKPENFDPKKRYPIIFHYYERLSDRLHQFFYPEVHNGTLNTSYYVSKGFLVFLPDIHYKIGYPGQSGVNALTASAKYFSKFSWIDSNRMGIQGHSRGGYQTNFIIAHNNHFAAAMSGAGYSDLISMYGGIRGNGESRQSGEELTFQRIGFNLWERPDLYINNSPVFKADKVETPLLMMNNVLDNDIPFAQGLEFFNALRRLQKRVWMLQYDGQGHSVFGDAALDLETRMFQFFNHYLKDAPAPIWMTQGIPAKLKGIETGYAYDPGGNCGKDCKVCKQWNAKMTRDSVATWKEIERRKKEEHWE